MVGIGCETMSDGLAAMVVVTRWECGTVEVELKLRLCTASFISLKES